MVNRTFVFALASALWPLAAAAQQVELLDFYLPTCGPCQAMAPIVARLEGEGVRVRKVNGQAEPQLAARLQVMSYPTFVAMANGVEVGRLVGATNYGELRKLITAAKPAGGQPGATPPTFAAESRPPRRERVATAARGLPAGGRQAAPAAANPQHAELLDASVRLTVDDPAGRAFGTGTIVDARQGEALVVTCAHLFRDASGQAIDTEGRLAVELFRGGRVVGQVAGTLVSHDFEADVALVAIRPEAEVAAAPVAASVGELRIGDPVRSVGCDLGADPTVRESRVVDLDRYNGPPNIEAAGAPVQGRSGGGLFDAAGRLVGVCNFADEQDDQGIYAGLASIHAQLDRVGLTDLYRQPTAAPAAVASFASAAAPASPQPRGLTPILRGQSPAAPAPPAGMAKAERAALGQIAKRGGEVVVLIRPDAPGAGTEVLTLDAASPAFLQALRSLGVATPAR
ncbi:trypsin-like peptidase domain-containing protein [Botrimarina sp.]|uniref:trypsin-like peptidase domain-containing protein n=1 Tax=Botrimarina sp. TaxID=2795802 RepID=UPI0032EDA6E1